MTAPTPDRLRVLILTNFVPETAGPEDQDTQVQRDEVASALERMGHKVLLTEHGGDLVETGVRLRALKPDLVFNLVEQLAGEGHAIHAVPTMLESLAIPFTGSGALALATSNDKRIAKRLMHAEGIKTPASLALDGHNNAPAQTHPSITRWIVKSATEHASHGLEDGSVVASTQDALSRIAERHGRLGGVWFAEQYIDGREFNLSLIEEESGPRVLPMAEMNFLEWPPARPRIMTYQAKWHEGSFDYEHTRRRYLAPGEDLALSERLRATAEQCWRLFAISGYGRVDIRVDNEGAIWVLEVNANPGLGPDGGMVAACEAAGIAYDDMIARILASGLGRLEPGS